MTEQPRTERILIWGKTRPELSSTYGELVCTGGVLESTKELIRIYPVPLRYLDDEKEFKKYQWIEASIWKSKEDKRPESYRIDFNSIVKNESIPTVKGSWDERAQWILAPGNVVQSVESILLEQKARKRSLGIMTPKEVSRVWFEPVSFDEKREWKKKYDAIYAKVGLPFHEDSKRTVRPIDPPDYRFKIRFRCDDERCTQDHNCSILDWELDALYFRQKQGTTQAYAATQVVEKVESICSDQHDTKFFLGNIANHPTSFTVVGLWYPLKKKTLENAMPLFAGVDA